MDSNATEFGQIEYQIRSGAEGKFEIHFKNGSITTTPTATFDYDITKEYKMIVSVEQWLAILSAYSCCIQK